MENPVYALRMPVDRRSCAVFSSPHSGAEYPAGLSAAVEPQRRWQMRSSEDAFVDELFATAPRAGAPLLAARVPRAPASTSTAAADDLDPALIAGASRRYLNARIAAGLGVIPRVVGEGRPIMQGKLTLAEAERRIRENWHPYHERLRSLLAEARDGLRHGDPDRLPLDAARRAERRPLGLGPAAGRDPRRPLRGRLRAVADRRRHRAPCRRRASSWRATRSSPAATSPRPTGGRAEGCRRCRSRSTARSTWTRRGSSGAGVRRRAARIGGWWPGSPRWPATAVGGGGVGRPARPAKRWAEMLPVRSLRTMRCQMRTFFVGVMRPWHDNGFDCPRARWVCRPDDGQKKRPCTRHGPSLGRKRP